MIVEFWVTNLKLIADDAERHACERAIYTRHFALDALPAVGDYVEWMGGMGDGDVGNWTARVLRRTAVLRSEHAEHRAPWWISVELCDDPDEPDLDEA